MTLLFRPYRLLGCGIRPFVSAAAGHFRHTFLPEIREVDSRKNYPTEALFSGDSGEQEGLGFVGFKQDEGRVVDGYCSLLKQSNQA